MSKVIKIPGNPDIEGLGFTGWYVGMGTPKQGGYVTNILTSTKHRKLKYKHTYRELI